MAIENRSYFPLALCVLAISLFVGCGGEFTGTYIAVDGGDERSDDLADAGFADAGPEADAGGFGLDATVGGGPDTPPQNVPTLPGTSATLNIWVFAHQDDETLAALGSIAEHEGAGQDNVIVTMTRGERTGICDGDNEAKDYGAHVAIPAAPIPVDPANGSAACSEVRYAELNAALVSAFGWGSFSWATWHRHPYGDGTLTVGQTKAVIDSLISLANANGYTTVRFKGHYDRDDYDRNTPGFQSHSDHIAIGTALRDYYAQGKIKDLRMFRIGHLLTAGVPCGSDRNSSAGGPDTMTAVQRAQKDAAMNAFEVYNGATRFAIAPRSASSFWNRARNTSECIVTPLAP